MQTKRLSTVSQQDIKWPGVQLKYSLMSQNIDLKEIDKYLFTQEQLKKEKMSIRECEEQLKKDPFNLQQTQDIVDVARYLVEDNNTEGFVDYRPDIEENIAIVRSVFKALVGHYKPYTPEQEKKLFDRLSQVIVQQQWQSQTLDYLQKKQTSKKKKTGAGQNESQDNFCTLEDMENFTQGFDVSQFLDKKELEYFFYKLFLTTNDVYSINVDKFFPQFKWDEQEKTDE